MVDIFFSYWSVIFFFKTENSAENCFLFFFFNFFWFQS